MYLVECFFSFGLLIHGLIQMILDDCSVVDQGTYFVDLFHFDFHLKAAAMAFFSKVGNILKQNMSKQITPQFSTTNLSVYQALRCMSSSRLFVGGICTLS